MKVLRFLQALAFGLGIGHFTFLIFALIVGHPTEEGAFMCSVDAALWFIVAILCVIAREMRR